MSKMKDSKMIVISFTKESKEVDVMTGNDEIKDVLMKNDKKLEVYIEEIRKQIPDKLSKKKIEVNVFLYLDKHDYPGVYTRIRYGFQLGKYLSNISSMLVDQMNQYFLSIIKVAIHNVDAKKLETVDDIL